MSETLHGEVTRVTYENEETGFRVIRLKEASRGEVTVVGSFQFVGAGTSVSVTGGFVSDARHGTQFRAHSLVPAEPKSLAGIERYLASGVIPGIGAGFAKRIVETFGLDTLKVLDTTPARLGEVAGLGAKRRRLIEEKWLAERARSGLRMQLHSLGLSPSLARSIEDRYGDRAAEVMQNNPFRLALEVKGVGFRTADAIAAGIGLSRSHPERVMGGLLHCLSRARDSGHTRLPRARLFHDAGLLLEVDLGHLENGTLSLLAQQRIVLEEQEGMDEPYVSLFSLNQLERELAARIAHLVAMPSQALPGVDEAVAAFEASASVTLAPQQREAVHLAADNKVLVLTGGPGVGKTTIVKAICSVFDHARLTVKLAAPTGRAAKRLGEATGREATTLHRLLEFEPRGQGFARNQDNPLEAQAVVVDESSMLDVELAAALFASLPERARLILVGDVDQLPSVGPGAVLRDLISSERVAVARLSQIFRQAGESLIVGNAHAILRGEEPLGAKVAEPSADFFVVKRNDPDAAQATICELVARRIPRSFALDGQADVQVLCPMRKGPTGTGELNRVIQQLLNPQGEALILGNREYRVGDRVMQMRNDYDREVFNGDVGRVEEVSQSTASLTVCFDGRQVRYAGKEAEELVLSYATTIHKSQGAEYPAVVIPVLNAHFMMLSRNLLYTAVTRAQRLCVLVADPRAIRLALSELRKEARYTGLVERLRGV